VSGIAAASTNFFATARESGPIPRATGITAYLETGGALENAQTMAADESPRTTKLYDRVGDEISLDEVARIAIRRRSTSADGARADAFRI